MSAFQLKINGETHRIETDGERPLLDVLREELGLTGTKFGCGEGECGACTVLIDGQAARSCITPVSEAAEREIRTIEGLAHEGQLHPVQQAFIEKGAMQCGYCVPGQIMNVVGLLESSPRATREQIIEQMDGNLCRCCNYPSLLAAAQRAAELMQESRS
jgi:aerobic-type carbon monoxide dehydrogenase small subunit (CoxS/CutS family)